MNRTKLRKIYRAIGSLSEPRPDRLAERATAADAVRRHAEHGLVAIVHGGIDCDGYRFDGCVRIVRAVPSIVEHEINGLYEHAEGPTWAHVMRPSRVSAQGAA